MVRMRTLLLFAFIASLLLGCSVPEQVVVTLDSPETVGQGAAFDFTVTVRNGDSKPHELRSIDISQSFLDGVGITETSVPTTDEYHAMGQRIFEFREMIPGNSDVEVVFSATALMAGDFSGDLDVCIDGDASCIFGSIGITVE